MFALPLASLILDSPELFPSSLEGFLIFYSSSSPPTEPVLALGSLCSPCSYFFSQSPSFILSTSTAFTITCMQITSKSDSFPLSRWHKIWICSGRIGWGHPWEPHPCSKLCLWDRTQQEAGISGMHFLAFSTFWMKKSLSFFIQKVCFLRSRRYAKCSTPIEYVIF